MRCIRRVNRSGLAGAVIEGWLSSSADLVAVIDGDLQHDEAILPKMYRRSPRTRAIWRSARASPTRRQPSGLSPARQNAQRSRRLVLPPDRRSGGRRSDERLLHDPPRDRRRARAPAVAGRLQDPRRRHPIRRQGTEDRRSPLCFSPAARGRVEIDRRSSASISSASSPITPAAVSLPTRFVLFASIGAIGLVVHVLALSAFRHWIRPGGLRFAVRSSPRWSRWRAISCSTTRSPIAPTGIAVRT